MHFEKLNVFEIRYCHRSIILSTAKREENTERLIADLLIKKVVVVTDEKLNFRRKNPLHYESQTEIPRFWTLQLESKIQYFDTLKDTPDV